MKKLFTLVSIFALVLVACDEGSEDNGDGNNGTILVINNMSGYNLLKAEYSSVNFGTINSGKDVKKNVSTGTKYVFFSLLIRNEEVRCRTTQALTCDEGNNEITFTNATFITTVIDERTNTIKNIVDTLIAEKGLMVGDTGPGGGIIFFAQGKQFKECSVDLGTFSQSAAQTAAGIYRGGGFTDWYLPSITEFELIHENLYKKNLGGFTYMHKCWSSTSEPGALWNTYYYYWDFDSSGWGYFTTNPNEQYRVRAVRAFTN